MIDTDIRLSVPSLAALLVGGGSFPEHRSNVIPLVPESRAAAGPCWSTKKQPLEFWDSDQSVLEMKRVSGMPL